MCLKNRIHSYCRLEMVEELTWLGFPTVGVDPALAEDELPSPARRQLVREYALPVTTPFVMLPPSHLRLIFARTIEPINRPSQIRATGWGVYRGSATLPAVVGKLLLGRFLAGRPITLIRDLTVDAVLAWDDADLATLSAHQREAIRGVALEARGEAGPCIAAIDTDVAGSFYSAEIGNRLYPLDRNDFDWATAPP